MKNLEKTKGELVLYSFVNPFSVVLILLAGAAFFIDLIIKRDLEKGIGSVIIITSMVVISGVIRIIQENRLKKTEKNLKSLISEDSVYINKGNIKVTNFAKGINSVSFLLIRFMTLIVAIIFIINGITKHNIIEAFLFSLSVAVVLTPEMLPMVVVTNLTKGAKNLANKKIIVKNVSCIQSLGAIDILCTDLDNFKFNNNVENFLEDTKTYNVEIKILSRHKKEYVLEESKKLGISNKRILTGKEIKGIKDEDLKMISKFTSAFVELDFNDKDRVINAIKACGNTIAFLGYEEEDSLAMIEADISIALDSSSTMAKNVADVVILDKNLDILRDSIIEGRRTFANIIKYVKLISSLSFGNMISILVASILLPFLPMMPIQILVLNLIFDISCLAIPWDNVDKEYLKKPRGWDSASIGSFIVWFGPISAAID